MKDFSSYYRVVYDIIGVAMEVHRVLHRGLLEAVYEEAMMLELKEKGYECNSQQEISIYYKGRLLEKKYRMDLVVGNVIVELKSVSEVCSEHRAQLCNYLRLTRKPVGLLINFGGSSLYGERWAFDDEVDECYLLNKTMERASI